jgi:hypothetical protein
MSTNTHPSVAESVLAEAQALHAAETADTATDAPEVVEAPADTSEDVEAADTADTAPDEADAQDQEAPKGKLSWDEAVKQVDPQVASLMKDLRAEFTRRTQKHSAERKQWERERKALQAARDQLKAAEDMPEYDPFNESTVQARIEAEVARRLNEALLPMQREYETMAAEDAYSNFLSDHPDFETDTALRSEVQSMLESNTNLDLETAYWAAKGRQTKAQREAQNARKRAERAARKEAAKKATAAPRRPGRPKPKQSDLKGMSTADILALAQSMNR